GTAHRDVPLSAAALQGPRLDGFPGSLAKAHASVPGEIFQACRAAEAAEICRGSDDDPFERPRETDSGHVSIDDLAQSHAGIESLRYDVGTSVLRKYLHLDFRVQCHEFGKQRLDQSGSVYPWNVQAQQSSGAFVFRTRGIEGLQQFQGCGLRPIEESLSGIGEDDRSRRSIQERYPRTHFERSNGLAHRGHG